MGKEGMRRNIRHTLNPPASPSIPVPFSSSNSMEYSNSFGWI